MLLNFCSEPLIETQIASRVGLMREIEIGILIDVDVVEAEKKMYVNCVSGWFKNFLIIGYI
jgi:hypothetical protein